MQPINYMLDVAQPLQMALAGYQQGRGMRAQEEGLAQQRRLMEMQEMEFQQQQQALQAQQQRAEQMNLDMAEVSDKVKNGTFEPSDMFEILNKYPEMSENLTNFWAQYNDEQKAVQKDEAVRLAVAARTNPEVARTMLEQRREAAQNSNDPKEIAAAEYAVKLLEQDPDLFITAELAPLAVLMNNDEYDNLVNLLNPQDELTEAARTKMQTAMMAGYEPGTPEFQEFIRAQEQRGPLVSVALPGEERETTFEAETGKQTAQNINTLITEGRNARRNLQRLDLLERRLDQIGDMGGLEAWAKVTLGQLGFETEGVEEAEALDALINQLIPTQRPPGSGEMSNKDVDLFRKSVPRLMSTVAGRYEVLRDMRAVNEYLDAEAEIAERVLIPKNDPRYLSLIDANSQIRALRNPLAKYREEGAADQTGLEAFWPNAQAEGVTRDQWDKMSPEQKSLFED